MNSELGVATDCGPSDTSASGADTETQPSQEPAPHTQRRRSQVKRSCSLCHRRKIRCDKQEPCAQCIRGGHTCFYPLPVPPTRRVRKTTIADVASRISDLEKTLVAVSGEVSAAATDAATSTPMSEGRFAGPLASRSVLSKRAITAPLHRTEKSSGEEILVHKGSSNQYYFNEVLISRVIDEENDIQSVLTTPRSEASQPTMPSPFNPMGILSSPCFDQPISAFHPPKQVAMQLWKIFVDYIDMTIKVLHIPTDEILVYTAIDNPEAASAEVLALCYAVYCISVLAVDENEVQSTLSEDKISSLKRFKLGFEQSLARADFLDNPTVTLLKALSIYLVALRVNNPGRGIWALNGLAIRISQSIGLHRDGQKLGLSPFESEMRRRLWWHFLSRDGRASEDYGIQTTTGLSPLSDARLPLNIHDDDLYPEMDELPPERKGFTRMVFPLAGIEHMRAWAQLSNIAASSPGPHTEEARLGFIEPVKERIGQYLQACNPVIPQQRVVLNVSSLLMRKLDIVTKHQWRTLQEPGARKNLATEVDLAEAVDFIEDSLKIRLDELTMPYHRWCIHSFPQYHMLLYILWHLCVRPEGPSVERAWAAVNTTFDQVQTQQLGLGIGSKWPVLQALKAKATAIRLKANGVGEAEQATAYLAADETNVNGLDSAHGVSGEGMDWNSDIQPLPDWDMLIQDFDLVSHDFTDYLP
ncbi:fungal-specific transcription factor [Truncatella angustata]|uniref:Fungal-specific transcription factor n=1 Tax=Truncatella angustata TaxID=152316 RepID=A0A9P8UTJ0_9PEZI|nr:fungal-specific transcription factor [Truncatella angustata]KAH6657802.1 fungal-specific transcription factor [Truncatella angustata]